MRSETKFFFFVLVELVAIGLRFKKKKNQRRINEQQRPEYLLLAWRSTCSKINGMIHIHNSYLSWGKFQELYNLSVCRNNIFKMKYYLFVLTLLVYLENWHSYDIELKKFQFFLLCLQKHVRESNKNIRNIEALENQG